MNGDHYAHYGFQYTQGQQQNHAQSWPNWNFSQPPPPPPPLPSTTVLPPPYPPQNYGRTNYSLLPPSHNVPPPNHARNQTYHRSSSQMNGSRSYYTRYPKGQSTYNGNTMSNRQSNMSNQGYKRNRTDSGQNDSSLKTNQPKKKKKPLSQNVPKRDWSIEEAREAFALEKELNKKCKTSLIIKFPDFEIKKEMVAQFHPSIESVHFQQPCTPRFCYVSLQDSANGDEVINHLNKQPFGNGFITAEFRKDKEEDLIVNPDDIDPLTLYVGNLSQEITKEDIQKMFPNCKRMDIGFAKKMKFTRYAFIVFRTVKESIEAFKKTHSKELYNKSLIVRFRRLHGTVGMAGESKIQNPPKAKDESSDLTNQTDSNIAAKACDGVHGLDSPASQVSNENKDHKDSDAVDDTTESHSAANSDVEALSPDVSFGRSSNSIIDLVDMAFSMPSYKSSTTNSTSSIEITDIKKERASPTNYAESSPSNYDDIFSSSSEKDLYNHRPIKSEIKTAIKKEGSDDDFLNNTFGSTSIKTEPLINRSTELEDTFQIKSEPTDDNEDIDYRALYEGIQESDEDDDDESDVPGFGNMFQNMMNHASRLSSLRRDAP